MVLSFILKTILEKDPNVIVKVIINEYQIGKRILVKASSICVLLLLTTSCSEFLILSSGTSAIVSQNTLSKAYNGVDMITTLQTDKNIKQHIFEKLKKDNQ